jgi:hypothetical protein
MADRARQVVGAAGGEVVAAVAGDEAGLREARVEIELLAELDESRIAGLGGGDGLDGLVAAGGAGMGGRGGEKQAGSGQEGAHH